jgi:hypothetical protein
MNPELWKSQHRIYREKDFALSVEATREQWDEVMPFSDPIPEFPSNGLSLFCVTVALVSVVGYVVLTGGGA